MTPNESGPNPIPCLWQPLRATLKLMKPAVYEWNVKAQAFLVT
jgi:hypothetical protein